MLMVMTGTAGDLGGGSFRRVECAWSNVSTLANEHGFKQEPVVVAVGVSNARNPALSLLKTI